MLNKTFAYCRVSTKEQNLDRQLIAIKDYCNKNNIVLDERDIFTDKESGKNLDREAYQALKRCVRRGDTLIIKELDRLSRSKDDIKKELDWFKQEGIRIKILNIPTTLIDLPEEQDWVFDMINNILIEVLGAIAEEERTKLKQRQAEGIAAAKAQGKQLGRPTIEYPAEFKNVYNDWTSGKITAVKAIELLSLKKTTFYKLVKDYSEQNQGN